MSETKLIGEFDASVWAKEFILTIDEILKNKPEQTLEQLMKDEGWLLGWFANAIMTGYDTSRNETKKDQEVDIVTPALKAMVALLKSNDPSVQLDAATELLKYNLAIIGYSQCNLVE